MNSIRNVLDILQFWLEINPAFPFEVIVFVVAASVGLLIAMPSRFVLVIAGTLAVTIGLVFVFTGNLAGGLIVAGDGILLIALGIRAARRIRRQRENEAALATEAARTMYRH